MAKRYRRVRRYYGRARARAKTMTLPIGILGGLAAGVAPAAEIGLSGNWPAAAVRLVYNYTGWSIQDNRFDTNGLKAGWMPLIVGFAAHKLAGMVGINRALGAAKVPLIRV